MINKEAHMDRISQLPDEIIHDILSCLPIKEAVKTSIVSKSWKRVYISYNIKFCLHFDHNSFALQKLSTAENGGEPAIHDIRKIFMNFVNNELLKLSKHNSPVMKLVLDVAVIDEEYYRVDQLLELVMQTKVEEFCLSVQTNGSRWYDEISLESKCYDFPYEVLSSSKWLQSLAVQGCMFASVLNYDLGAFSSLRHLWLSHVMVSDEKVLTNLAYCCPEIELIEFDSCTLWMLSLDLSIFPKLKKAFVVDYQYGELESIDLENTNLESLYCDTMHCMLGDTDSRKKIKELTMRDIYYSFNDFTAAFPLIENAKLVIDGVEDIVNRFEASSNCLETLDLTIAPFLKMLSIYCENLWHFNYVGGGFANVDIDCPKLWQFNYLANELPDDGLHWASSSRLKTFDLLMAPSPKMLYVNCENLRYFNYEGFGFEKVNINCPNLRLFNYWATKLPDVLGLTLSPDVYCINFGLHLRDNLHTSWFINLRNFLERIARFEICLHLRINSHKAEFVLDELRTILPVFQQNKVHLIVQLQCADMQNPGALVDGLLWSIHPTALTIRGHCLTFVKVLHERLVGITQDDSCCEPLRLCTKFWQHNLVYVYFKNGVEDMKKLASMAEMNNSSTIEFCFDMQWQLI